MRRNTIIVIALALVIAGGISSYFFMWRDTVDAVMVPLNDIPPHLVKKAQETLLEVKFDHARKLVNGNYEIRGKAKNGKIREVEVNAVAEVVEIE